MKHILIYGSSIFLTGLAEQVRALPHMRVEMRQSLARLGNVAIFDAVLVDLNNPATADALTLLRARPDLIVIGLNQATGTLTVLAGQTYLVQSLNEVMAYLENLS